MIASPSRDSVPPTAQVDRLPHVRELDGIRGIAALAVFCHHALFTSIPHPERWNAVVGFLSTVSQGGAWGVDLFFVLSGYLITSILLADRGRPHYYWNFYWKRALRIFPLYIVALLVLAVVYPQARAYFVLSLLFVANFAPLFHVVADGPFWTLAIEEQFYLAWPQFAKSASGDGLRRLAVGLAAGCLALRLVAASQGHHNFRFTFFHCDGLALGAVLACQRVRGAGAGRRGVLGAAVLGAAVGGVLLTLLPLLVPAGGRVAMAAEALQITGISLVGYSIVRAMVEHAGAKWLAPLRSSVLTFFGLISYCLYLSHLYLLRAYDRVLGEMVPGSMWLYTARFFGVLALTVAVCVISRYAIELPAMRLRRVVLRR